MYLGFGCCLGLGLIRLGCALQVRVLQGIVDFDVGVPDYWVGIFGNTCSWLENDIPRKPTLVVPRLS